MVDHNVMEINTLGLSTCKPCTKKKVNGESFDIFVSNDATITSLTPDVLTTAYLPSYTLACVRVTRKQRLDFFFFLLTVYIEKLFS